MSHAYLEITFRKGRAFAAYLYLPTPKRERSVRTRCFAPGLVVDLARDGRPLGIEITAPARVTLAAINRALRTVGASPVTSSELAPLHAA